MKSAAKFAVQRGVNPPLAFHPRKAVKLRRDYAHIKMTFATRPVASMAFMKSALVRNRQLIRRESNGEFAPYVFRDRHERRLHLDWRQSQAIALLVFYLPSPIIQT